MTTGLETARTLNRRIDLHGVGKVYKTAIGSRAVLRDISFSVQPGEKLAVLGRNGSGKSTLVKLIAGVEPPSIGTIHRGMKMSWPIAFSGGFELNMSGIDNIRFISRIYGVDFKDALAIIDEFAELGHLLRLPVFTYSSGMRSRLAFGLTLAVEFECFLIDEVISVGDQRFQRKCHDELFVKRQNSAMILVSHDVNIIKNYCNKALVLKGGRGRVFDDLEFAITIYNSL